MSKVKKVEYELGIWDWKEDPYDDLSKILRRLDVHMYSMPSFNGTDMYGFIFTKEKLTQKQVRQLDREQVPRE